MTDEENRRSLVPRPSREVTVRLNAQNRIVSEMVENLLDVAKDAAREAEDLDALVREARRAQGKTAGMTPENIHAFDLFLRAARAGHPGAQREVAMCFRENVGVEHDGAECDKWLRLAAEGGDAEAQWMYGMFRSGTGAESVKWLRKAAEQGNLDAQIHLGEFYGNGDRVPQDYYQAYAWLQLAADAAAEDPAVIPVGWVQEEATAIAALLSPVQLENARELYQDFKRKYPTKQ